MDTVLREATMDFEKIQTLMLTIQARGHVIKPFDLIQLLRFEQCMVGGMTRDYTMAGLWHKLEIELEIQGVKVLAKRLKWVIQWLTRPGVLLVLRQFCTHEKTGFADLIEQWYSPNTCLGIKVAICNSIINCGYTMR